jgi:excisionase family DNA binding protein
MEDSMPSPLAPDPPTPWLTIDELAHDLRVARRTMERWIARHEPGIEVLRLGRRMVRVRLTDVATCRISSGAPDAAPGAR